jgi:hypothetical protein
MVAVATACASGLDLNMQDQQRGPGVQEGCWHGEESKGVGV